MLRLMCKSKINRVRITKKDLNYGGSIGIDKVLLDASDILPNEMVQVLNLRSGARFETYVIEEAEGSGTVALYGPATYQGEIGDIVIIISTSLVEEKDARLAAPKIVSVDAENRIVKKKR